MLTYSYTFLICTIEILMILHHFYIKIMPLQILINDLHNLKFGNWNENINVYTRWSDPEVKGSKESASAI